MEKMQNVTLSEIAKYCSKLHASFKKQEAKKSIYNQRETITEECPFHAD